MIETIDAQEKDALLSAIKIIGSQSVLARKLGIKQQTVFVWTKTGLPPRRVLQVEQLTGGKISRHDLKPSIYPRDE